jgi:hypothetical protein
MVRRERPKYAWFFLVAFEDYGVGPRDAQTRQGEEELAAAIENVNY